MQPALAELVKLDIYRELMGEKKDLSVALAKVKIDDEELHLLVDTGSQYTFGVWKTWYEEKVPGGCDKLIYKCYECKPPPCTKGPTKTIEFADGTEADIFQQSGSLDLNQLGSKLISFGLVSRYTSPYSIHAGLGLGPATASIKPYTPILKQLEGVLPSTAFSLYLRPGDKPSGQLILGGQDPSLYQGPIVNFNFDEFYGIQLSGFRVGDDSYSVDPASGDIEIDTGASDFLVPWWALQKIVEYLKTRGTKQVEINKIDDVYEVACDDVKYLPPLTIFLKDSIGKDTPLTLSPEVYVLPPAEPGKASCLLIITDSSSGDWVLGCNVLVGRYFYFNYDQKVMGFASLKEG
ncbi:hypothetical protein FOL47_003455 [Perkinsus chesapeaki]|uniref:Peptidase A1 domain-containing protein n=1 Tax=Perkinsus chesapeaki TaxID=330153 RepID=A0A7J6M863_PERCH|nr:hypothetical protein FOL47_003455 [Perkinsus chesapeaki]